MWWAWGCNMGRSWLCLLPGPVGGAPGSWWGLCLSDSHSESWSRCHRGLPAYTVWWPGIQGTRPLLGRTLGVSSLLSLLGLPALRVAGTLPTAGWEHS